MQNLDPTPHPTSNHSAAQRRILCLWFPQWPLQRTHRKSTPLRILYREDRQRGRQVAMASAAAARRGVRLGMPLAEAESLLGKSARYQALDSQSDREALGQLAVWAQQYSPHVGLETVAPCSLFSPESLLADVTRTSHYFGGEWKLLHAAARSLARRGLQVRLAIAHSIGAAWGIAHTASSSPVSAPGYTSTAPLPSLLADLPVSALRLPAAALTTLQTLGLETAGQLAALPSETLRLRLDPLVLKRLDQFLGRIDESIRVEHRSPKYRCHINLEPPATSWDLLEFSWSTLADQLAEQLAADHRGALQLDVELGTPCGPSTHSLHFSQPSANAQAWLRLWQLKRESLREVRAIDALTLTVPLTAQPNPHRTRSLPWQDTTSPQVAPATEEWQVSLDRLAARLGPGALFRPRLLAEAVPERAWAPQPPHRSPRSLAPKPLRKLFPAGRPLHLAPAPIPIVMSTTLPLKQFSWQGRRHDVRRVWGPERLEVGWWRGPSVRREYYHLETSDARRWWFYYCLPQKKWYLHGWDG